MDVFGLVVIFEMMPHVIENVSVIQTMIPIGSIDTSERLDVCVSQIKSQCEVFGVRITNFCLQW